MNNRNPERPVYSTGYPQVLEGDEWVTALDDKYVKAKVIAVRGRFYWCGYSGRQFVASHKDMRRLLFRDGKPFHPPHSLNQKVPKEDPHP